MIGIYKITSPNKRVYIGQSLNIQERFKAYKRLSCKKQIKLYSSLKKHGVNKHVFEVLCECKLDELNEKERYYQDLYSVLGKNGLNCILTKGSDRASVRLEVTEETRIKLSQTSKGRIFSNESRIKMSEYAKKRKYSEATRFKMSVSARNKTGISDSTRIKLSEKSKKIVIDINTGVYYDSAMEVSNLYGLNYRTFCCYLNGQRKNKTQFIYA